MSGSCVKTKQSAASALAGIPTFRKRGYFDEGRDTAELLERLVDFVLSGADKVDDARWSVMDCFKSWNYDAREALLNLLVEKVTKAGHATIAAAGFTSSWRAALQEKVPRASA